MSRPRNRKNRDLPPHLYLYKDGAYLYERPDKRRFSLGKNKNRAIRLAIQLNNELRIPSAAEEHLLRRILDKNTHTFNATIERYISEFLPQRGLAVKTLSESIRLLRIASTALAEIPIDLITVKQIADLIDAHPPNTGNKIRAQLNQFFGWAIAKGLTGSNPAAATLKQRETVTRQRLSIDHYRAIHAAAECWFQNTLDLALQTLQRREDLCWMRFSDIKNGRLFVQQRKTARHNTGRLAIKINPPLQSVIDRCRDNLVSPFLIHRAHAKRRAAAGREHWSQLQPEMLSREFQALRDRLGLYADLSPDQRPSFHEIRALGAHLYEQSGTNPQPLLGHTSAKMTRVYLDRHAETDYLDVDAGLVFSADL